MSIENSGDLWSALACPACQRFFGLRLAAGSGISTFPKVGRDRWAHCGRPSGPSRIEPYVRPAGFAKAKRGAALPALYLACGLPRTSALGRQRYSPARTNFAVRHAVFDALRQTASNASYKIFTLEEEAAV
jgi:hypothetical protein